MEKSAIADNCQDLFDKSNVAVDMDHGHRARTSTEAECSHFDSSFNNSAVTSQTKDSVQKSLFQIEKNSILKSEAAIEHGDDLLSKSLTQIVEVPNLTANKEKENIPHVCHCEETSKSRQNQKIIDALVQLVKCEPSALHEKVLSNMHLCIHNLKSGDIVTQLCDIVENELDYGCDPSQLPTEFREILKKQEHIKFMDRWAIELKVAYDNEHFQHDVKYDEEYRNGNSRTRKLLFDFFNQVQYRDFSVKEVMFK